jgi:hypothetical protein
MAEQQPGPADAAATIEGGLAEFVGAVTGDKNVPEEAKQAFQASHEAFRAGLEALAGGAKPQDPSGTVTMEQGGAKGAVPMSHGRPA